MDVKKGGGRGLDLNVHWTLKFLFSFVDAPLVSKDVFIIEEQLCKSVWQLVEG